jgi:class 3 adenylate cyclase
MPELPSGTMTFLFTDVEGSTALWEQAPEAMRAAFARHDTLLRTAIGAHGGHVVKTAGDGFHAAGAALREVIGAAWRAGEREDVDRSLNLARSHLGEDAFAKAWTEGRALMLDQAIAYAPADPEPGGDDQGR